MFKVLTRADDTPQVKAFLLCFIVLTYYITDCLKSQGIFNYFFIIGKYFLKYMCYYAKIIPLE